jgi:diguanylate cyclase (GGDEF)-like protein
MTTIERPLFVGFNELLRKPLERTDTKSYALIRQLLLNTPANAADPFCSLIEMLSGITIAPSEAVNHWKKILEHKRRLELKLSRTVNIKTASIDYYDQLGVAAPEAPRTVPATQVLKQGNTRMPDAGPTRKTGLDGRHSEHGTASVFYQERLKEEMLRARRYKHALSVVLVYVDLRTFDDTVSEKVLPVIVKMINKAVRIVDIRGRYATETFLLILPNTNKREALELAERLKKNIIERTGRISGLAAEFPIAFALGQCSRDDTAADFIIRLKNLAEAKKTTIATAIAVLE